MVGDNNLEMVLNRFGDNPPSNAIALRSASAQIVSKWIKSGRPYPHEIIDGFVYIESSIESSIEENISNAVNLQIDTEDAFKFHIKKFTELLKELKGIISVS